MLRRGFVASVGAAAMLLHVAVWAETVSVSTLDDFRAALAVVQPGDVIEVQYGVYEPLPDSDHKHWFTQSGTEAQPIVIRGVANAQGERPVFDAANVDIDRGIFYLWDYVPNYVIENLEFRNSSGGSTWSQNAAAAYIRADNITFRNCYSHHNDNGWFSTFEVENTVLEYCETAFNGTGEGQTHNYYVNSQTMTVRGNYIHDSVGGQNFKSRCWNLVFENNWLERDGNYAWEIASDNRNNTLMIGNVIIKGAAAPNGRIVGISDGAAAYGTLTMINNTIVATAARHHYIYSNANAYTNLVMYNNILTGASSQLFPYWSGSGTRTGSHNWFQTGMEVPEGITDSLFGDTPRMRDGLGRDCYLLADSPCRDVGNTSPMWLNRTGQWEVRVPTGQYVMHAANGPRPDDGLLDIGALECLPGDLDFDADVDVDDVTILVEEMTGPVVPYRYTDAGEIVIEAERFTSRSDGSGSAQGWRWDVVSGGGSMGDGYVRATPDTGLEMADPVIESDSPRLSYDVNFERYATLYYVWVKGRAADEDSDTVYYGLNGDAVGGTPGTALVLPVGPDFEWVNTRATTYRASVLPMPGVASLDFWVCEDGAQIDRILLTTDGTYQPTEDVAASPAHDPIGSDQDGDGDVDVADVAVFAAHMTGP